MLQKALDSVLPGLRDFRVPLVSGALWSLLIWIWFLGDRVPQTTPTNGLWNDAAELIDFLGRGGTVAVGGAAMFLVGLLAMPLTDALAAATGGLTRRAQDRVRWQRKATAMRRTKQREIHTARNDSTKAKAKETVELLSRGRFGLVMKDERSMAIVGRARQPHIDRAEVLADDAYNDGAAAEWRRLDVRGELPRGRSFNAGWDLISELSDHPLDALQVLDEAAFLAADRAKAEREFRLAVSVPLMPLGGVLCATNAVAGLLVAAAALGVTCREAAMSDDLGRVLGFLGYTGKRTPALRSAEREGARDAHQAALEVLREERRVPPPG